MFAHRSRLLSKRLENYPLRLGEGVFYYGDEENDLQACLRGHLTTINLSENRVAVFISVTRSFMDILQGYVYHIKDTYFGIANDENLMQNKEQGNYRPTLYCVKDEITGLLWMVPITSQYDKFAAIRDKILKKGKPCRGIILGEFDGQKAAFLVQNMFPITEDYIDHIHTKNGNPVPVKKELQKIIKKNVKILLTLNDRGIKVTFTDISRLKALIQEH